MIQGLYAHVWALKLRGNFITTKIWSQENFLHYHTFLNDLNGCNKFLMFLMLLQSFEWLNIYLNYEFSISF